MLVDNGTVTNFNYNWDREVNPNASPLFLVEKHEKVQSQKNYTFEECNGLTIRNKSLNYESIGKISDKSPDDIFNELKDYQLHKYIN